MNTKLGDLKTTVEADLVAYKQLDKTSRSS